MRVSIINYYTQYYIRNIYVIGTQGKGHNFSWPKVLFVKIQKLFYFFTVLQFFKATDFKLINNNLIYVL